MTLHLNEDQLIGYTHQTLTDAERETIDQHLAGCPPCRAVLDDHENLQRRIHNDLSTELRHNGPSPRMNYAAMAPRVKRQRRYYVFTKQSSQLLSNAVAIIVLVVAGFGLLYLFNSIGQPETAPLERVTTIAVEATEQPATVPATEVSQPSVGATAEVNQPPAGPVEFVMEITGDPNPFSNPVDVAVDQAGNLYVVDGFNHRIQKFDPNGQFLTMWGSKGDGDGQFKFAIGLDAADAAVAVDEQGQVYVADSRNTRLQKFNGDGQFLAKWGSYGTGDGQFLKPTGMEVDKQGNVYVLDGHRDDIQKFDGEGRFLAKWSSRGMEASQSYACGPSHLAVDEAGNVYIADTDANHVSKFDPNGQLLTMWGEKGSADGQFHWPCGLATDGQGHIFVVDQFNNRIQMFDQQGQFLGQWGTLGSGPGQFKEPAGLTVDKEGYIYVADYGNNRIQKFRLVGAATDEAAAKSQVPVEFVMEITGDPNPFSNPVDVAVDQAGNLYVVDGFNHRIQKFDPNGQFLTMWGSQGDGDGQFKFAIRIDAADAAVAVDEQGQVYVADLGNARIQKFDSGGQFLATWGSYGLDNGQFLHPTGVAVDQQGNVYVLDIGRDDVQKFDGEGRFLAKWGSRGMEAGQLSGAFYLAVDMAGNVYVPDTDTNRVSKFDPNGQLLTMWGENGSADGQFHGPYGIATDGQGHIFVVDQFNNRIQMFDQQGQFLGQWGTLGNGPGQFKEPAGLTVDKEGYIYVADYGNNRIQKFRLLEIGASVNGN